MKNQLLSVLLFVAASLASCSSKSAPTPAVDCAAILKKFTDAFILYSQDVTSSVNCKAYLAAANELLNNSASCGSLATDIATARQVINATTCP